MQSSMLHHQAIDIPFFFTLHAKTKPRKNQMPKAGFEPAIFAVRRACAAGPPSQESAVAPNDITLLCGNVVIH